MVKTKARRVLRKKDVRIAAASRRNPNSLRRLLILVREQVFEMNLEQFGDNLNKYGNIYHGELARMNGEKVKNLEADKTYTHYIHIERYAHSVGLPSGLFLLFSRLMSFEHNGDKERIARLRNVILEIFETINENTEFNRKELERWGVRNQESEARQLSLLPMVVSRPKS